MASGRPSLILNHRQPLPRFLGPALRAPQPLLVACCRSGSRSHLCLCDCHSFERRKASGSQHSRRALVGNDPEVISEFLRDFRASSDRIAAELRSACQAGQAQAAGAAAHKLKSSARSVGALALGELCAEMERAGKAGDMQALNALLPRFEAELGAVDTYIDSLQA